MRRFIGISQLYFVVEAYRLYGFKPFTAQIFAYVISNFVDALIATAMNLSYRYKDKYQDRDLHSFHK